MSFKYLSLFLSLCVMTEGLVLSPSGEIVICEREQVELTCSTNVSILGWVSSPLKNEQGQLRTFNRFISSVGASQQESYMTVNSTFFNVSRVSSENELPLVSIFLIDPVVKSLNGTEVNCTERAINNEDNTVGSTTIYIIGEYHTANKHLKVNTSVEYETDNCTVTLEWIPNTRTSYVVSVEHPYILTSSTTNAQLSVPYNTHVHVSIMASWCGQYTYTSTIIELHYAKCDYPILNNSNNSQIVQVMGYVNPSLEGTTINFSCPTGQILAGPRSSTCLGNGEWEMESNISCIVNCGSPLLPPNGYIIQSNDTTEGSSISFVCLTAHPETAVVYTSTCNQAGDWEPRPTDICQLVDKGACSSTLTLAVVSSTCVFIFTSILFFLFGYACGRKSGKKISENVNPIIHENTIPGPELMDLTKNEAYDLLNTRGTGISQP